MAKILRRAKRIHKIRFADGVIFTILDIEPSPQTGQITLWLKKSVGSDIILIPMLMGMGLMLGYFAFQLPGAMAGALLAAFGGFGLISFTSVGKSVVKRILPGSSIIGFDSYFSLKNRSYTFCTHSYDSAGNMVPPTSDPVQIMERQVNDRDWQIKFLRSEINTLRFNLAQKQIGEEEMVDEVARRLEKILESSVTKVHARPYTQPPGILPEMLGQVEQNMEEER